MDVTDRVIGCVLGLALGDALGAPFEGLRAHAVPRPLPAFRLPWRGLVGATTDDTALARNLVRSLAERGAFDPADLVRRHVEWFRSGAPGIGHLTRHVLALTAEGADADAAAREVWERRGPEVSAGNGSVMYCAPLGAAYAGRRTELPAAAARLSRLTHYDPRCVTAVGAVTAAAALLVDGMDAVAAVEGALHAVANGEGGEELQFLVDAVGVRRPVDGPDQGFCLFTAALALQTVAREEGFEDGLRRVVRLGGDTDTNAAVAGALLGCRDGRSRLPKRWVELLQEAHGIEAEARALAATVEAAGRSR